MIALRGNALTRSRAGRIAPVIALAAALAIFVPLSSAAAARSHPRNHGNHRTGRWHNHSNALELTTIFSGTTLGISQPDDITSLDGQIFVGFQNGVGPQGQASSTGNLDSTIVELSPTGVVEGSWSVVGKCDGLVADRSTGQLIATVNEDLNSSLYTIDPSTDTIVHYTYSPSTLPHNGGTDAISVINGTLYISASAPGTVAMSPAPPQSTYPALYSVSLDSSTQVATATPVFSDAAPATIANTGSTSGQTTTLGLTDPDSNTVVPSDSPRFAGDLMLDSQGDLQQIYVKDIGQSSQSLTVLNLTQSVDDSAWATSHEGSLYITDNKDNIVDALRGHFTPGTVYTSATPCGANSAPSVCPATGFPPNYLATLDLNSGAVTAVNLGGEMVQSQGLLFLSGSGRQNEGQGGNEGNNSQNSHHHHHNHNHHNH